MSYDEAFAARIRQAIGPRSDVSEKKMFGGICFLLDSKMFCGIATAELMVRVGLEAYEAALAEPHARPMDFTGRPLSGYVFVDRAGLRSAAALKRWIDRGLSFVATLPAGPAKRRGRAAAPAITARGGRRPRAGR